MILKPREDEDRWEIWKEGISNTNLNELSYVATKIPVIHNIISNLAFSKYLDPRLHLTYAESVCGGEIFTEKSSPGGEKSCLPLPE
jgi:hypothetical protein